MTLKENISNDKIINQVAAIELQNVVHTYGKQQANSKSLHFSQWKVEIGQQVFLYGDSGSGKSTLLNLLSGILAPQLGSIKLFGTEMSDLSNSGRDRFRAENIGVVFQQFNLIPYLSVAKNIELAVYLAKSSKQQLVESLQQLMAALKLPSSILHTPVSSLSVGQQQRVAIMRAFINAPKLLLIDEPTSALDNSAKHGFMTLLLEMCQAHNTTMIFVSHDTGLEPFFSLRTPITSFCNGISDEVVG
ncbi:ABC transporter ATP-binding protein [Paraglaciecola marina]|uniref:ABC transporter ATP-binding protein n=1 Tax=Paraglaciecola marina TaxID=2500157 RepID=UPI0010614C16|nr:ATP-binding cassette domain-containing protein [Paraglaciecola marina]